VDLWVKVLKRYSKFGGAPLDLFSESFEYKKKTELVQILIQMWIYAVGGRADVLPSVPSESVFKQD
jgi:hypothetical protein